MFRFDYSELRGPLPPPRGKISATGKVTTGKREWSGEGTATGESAEPTAPKPVKLEIVETAKATSWNARPAATRKASARNVATIAQEAARTSANKSGTEQTALIGVKLGLVQFVGPERQGATFGQIARRGFLLGRLSGLLSALLLWLLRRRLLPDRQGSLTSRLVLEDFSGLRFGTGCWLRLLYRFLFVLVVLGLDV